MRAHSVALVATVLLTAPLTGTAQQPVESHIPDDLRAALHDFLRRE